MQIAAPGQLELHKKLEPNPPNPTVQSEAHELALPLLTWDLIGCHRWLCQLACKVADKWLVLTKQKKHNGSSGTKWIARNKEMCPFMSTASYWGVTFLSMFSWQRPFWLDQWNTLGDIELWRPCMLACLVAAGDIFPPSCLLLTLPAFDTRHSKFPRHPCQKRPHVTLLPCPQLPFCSSSSPWSPRVTFFFPPCFLFVQSDFVLPPFSDLCFVSPPHFSQSVRVAVALDSEPNSCPCGDLFKETFVVFFPPVDVTEMRHGNQPLVENTPRLLLPAQQTHHLEQTAELPWSRWRSCDGHSAVLQYVSTCVLTALWKCNSHSCVSAMCRPLEEWLEVPVCGCFLSVAVFTRFLNKASLVSWLCFG